MRKNAHEAERAPLVFPFVLKGAARRARIGAAARRAGCVEVLVIDDPIAACEEALRQAGADDAILVAGSIYVVGAVRPTLLRHSGR